MSEKAINKNTHKGTKSAKEEDIGTRDQGLGFLLENIAYFFHAEITNNNPYSPNTTAVKVYKVASGALYESGGRLALTQI